MSLGPWSPVLSPGQCQLAWYQRGWRSGLKPLEVGKKGQEGGAVSTLRAERAPTSNTNPEGRSCHRCPVNAWLVGAVLPRCPTWEAAAHRRVCCRQAQTESLHCESSRSWRGAMSSGSWSHTWFCLCPSCVISDAAEGTGAVFAHEEEHSTVLGKPTAEACCQRSCP